MSNQRTAGPTRRTITSPPPGTRAHAGAGPVAAVGGIAAILGGATLMFPTPDPGRPGFLLFNACNVVAFVLLIVAVATLWRLDVAGPGWLGRIGLATSTAALIGFTGTEIATRFAPTVGESIHPITVPLLAIGMVVVGIAVIRARVWRGWVRPTPLICGVAPLAIELPWFIAFGPNATVISLTWATWLLLGVALVATSITHRGR